MKPMKRYRLLKVLTVVVLCAVAATLMGLTVMALWNWLVPGLTGWHALNFPQALGLLVLCRVLFGGFRGHPGFRRRMRARWGAMTPEERERLRAGLHRHWRCEERGTHGEPS